MAIFSCMPLKRTSGPRCWRPPLGTVAPRRRRKKDLSGLLDAAAHQRLLEEQQHDAAFLAHMSLCRVPGAGAWLTAPPAEDGREVDAPLFKVALKRRLRAPVYDEDGFCPCCGGVLDRWGDHALVCP